MFVERQGASTMWRAHGLTIALRYYALQELVTTFQQCVEAYGDSDLLQRCTGSCGGEPFELPCSVGSLCISSSSRLVYSLWSLAHSTLEVDECMVSKITLLVFSFMIWYITTYRSVEGLTLSCSTPGMEDCHPISDGLI